MKDHSWICLALGIVIGAAGAFTFVSYQKGRLRDRLKADFREEMESEERLWQDYTKNLKTEIEQLRDKVDSF